MTGSHGWVTPGVARAVFATIAAFIGLRTVATAPAVAAGLRFDPAALAERPWSVATYPLVHESALHLAATSLLLLGLGPRVERALGQRLFLFFLLYCTVGAALAALAVAQLVPIPPLSGALAPALGLAFAHATLSDDREIALDPLPVRARVAVLAGGLVATVLVLGALRNQAGLSLGHVGAVAAAWLFFRLRGAVRPSEPVLPVAIRRPALAPAHAPRDARRAATPAPAAPAPTSMGVEEATEAVNRLLDKISRHGLDSLTAEERQLLTEYAERKKRRS